MISTLPLHPLVVHFPVVLAFLLPLGALFTVFLLWRKKDPLLFTRLVALGSLALVASAFLAMQTGEADEDLVEPIVGEAALEGHEERAETFAWTSVGVLGVALATTLLTRRRHLLVGLAGLTAAGSIAVAVLAVGVGHSGGELVYLHGAASAHVPAAATATRAAPRPQGLVPDDGRGRGRSDEGRRGRDRHDD